MYKYAEEMYGEKISNNSNFLGRFVPIKHSMSSIYPNSRCLLTKHFIH